MTNLQMLELLSDFHDTSGLMALWMHNAIEGGRDERYVWLCLFMWVELRDLRDTIWKQLHDHHVDAIMLREGKKP